MLIQDIYRKDALTIAPDATVGHAVAQMEDVESNGFVVVDAVGKVVGVLALQDIAAAIIPNEFRDNPSVAQAMYKKGFFHEQCALLGDKPVAEVMRKKFMTVDLSTSIMAVIAEFLVGDLYIVPVVEKGKLVGVISRTEIKHALMKGFA